MALPLSLVLAFSQTHASSFKTTEEQLLMTATHSPTLASLSQDPDRSKNALFYELLLMEKTLPSQRALAPLPKALFKKLGDLSTVPQEIIEHIFSNGKTFTLYQVNAACFTLFTGYDRADIFTTGINNRPLFQPLPSLASGILDFNKEFKTPIGNLPPYIWYYVKELRNLPLSHWPYLEGTKATHVVGISEKILPIISNTGHMSLYQLIETLPEVPVPTIIFTPQDNSDYLNSLSHHQSPSTKTQFSGFVKTPSSTHDLESKFSDLLTYYFEYIHLSFIYIHHQSTLIVPFTDFADRTSIKYLDTTTMEYSPLSLEKETQYKDKLSKKGIVFIPRRTPSFIPFPGNMIRAPDRKRLQNPSL